MQPVEIQLDPHTRGDTWEGLIIGPVLINTLQPNYPIESCRLHFKNIDGTLAYALSDTPTATEGSITITNATTWEITVPEQVLDMPVGTFPWDFEVVDTSGKIWTLYKGTFVQTPDQTV